MLPVQPGNLIIYPDVQADFVERTLVIKIGLHRDRNNRLLVHSRFLGQMGITDCEIFIFQSKSMETPTNPAIPLTLQPSVHIRTPHINILTRRCHTV
jgi:hypothetical protein